MTGKGMFAGVAVAVLLVLGLIGLGFFAFHAGEAHALAGGAMMADGRHFYGPWFGGFFFFPLFFIVPFLFFGLMRLLFFGFDHRRWMDGQGGERMHQHLEGWHEEAHRRRETVVPSEQKPE